MSDSAKKYTIAVIPGDGIGKEVTPWAQKALEKAAEGVAEFDYENFDLGAERYLRDGAILPEEEEERIKKTDAILVGRSRRSAYQGRHSRTWPAAQAPFRSRPVRQPASVQAVQGRDLPARQPG